MFIMHTCRTKNKEAQPEWDPMVIQIVGEVKLKRPNLFLSKEEAAILWAESYRWGLKWRCMLALAMFRGMRIKEVCNAQLHDFRLDSKGQMYLTVILCKSHIKDELPLLPEVADLISQYVRNNLHLMKNGYLFPNRHGSAGISTEAAGALFAKMRNIVAKKHLSFSDRRPIMNPQTNMQRTDRLGRLSWRYRISWHSCRRFFETSVWTDEKYGKDLMILRDVMRYRDTRSCEPYINSYELYTKEPAFLQQTFGAVINDFNLKGKGQSKIHEFQTKK